MEAGPVEQKLIKDFAKGKYSYMQEQKLKEQFREKFGREIDWEKEALALFDISKGFENYIGLGDINYR